MKIPFASPLGLFLLMGCLEQVALLAEPPASPPEQRRVVKDLNTPREFPKIASREEWQVRAKEIREQVLVSCGLWPMPEKTPPQWHLFGRNASEGYSVGKG